MVFREAIKNSIFHEISNYCSANNIESFVVGGFVRDFFLKRPSKDIDILIIGDGITVAKQIAKQIDSKISVTIFKKSFLDSCFQNFRRQSYLLPLEILCVLAFCV